jgi:NAD(P)-dependent dehydrogenase (short-subunit alcohol dehydrogenase family)
MLTISLAHDLHGKVRCWAVHPGKLATDLGQADAVKDPREAAQQLRMLLDTADNRSPRYVSLGETDLDW